MHTIRSINTEHFRPGLLYVVRGEAEDLGVDVVTPIYREFVSKYAFERVTGVSGSSVFQQVPEGSPIPTAQFSYIGARDYFVRKFGLGYAVSKEADRHDLYRVLEGEAIRNKLGMSRLNTRNIIGTLPLNNAFTALSDGSNLCIDGQPLISHSHPLKVGTYSNRGNGSADLALSVSALETAWQRLTLQPTFEGIRQPYRGKMYLVVPPQLEMVAHRLVLSPFRPQSTGDTFAPNDRNIINASGRFDVFVNPYLTSATAWFLIPQNKAAHYLHLMTRMPLDVDIVWNAKQQVWEVIFTEEYFPFASYWHNVWGTTG